METAACVHESKGILNTYAIIPLCHRYTFTAWLILRREPSILNLHCHVTTHYVTCFNPYALRQRAWPHQMDLFWSLKRVNGQELNAPSVSVHLHSFRHLRLFFCPNVPLLNMFWWIQISASRHP